MRTCDGTKQFKRQPDNEKREESANNNLASTAQQLLLAYRLFVRLELVHEEVFQGNGSFRFACLNNDRNQSDDATSWGVALALRRCTTKVYGLHMPSQ